MNREQRLTDHANLKLHYNINDEKIEMQNYYNRMGNLRSNDQLIAKAWERVPRAGGMVVTGMNYLMVRKR